MKKYFIFVLLSFLSFSGLQAQSAKGSMQDDYDKIKELRIGFITEKVDISAAQGEKFWPIYNAYCDRIEVFRRNQMKTLQSLKPDELTSEKAGKIMDDLLTSNIQQEQARMTLYKNLNGILSKRQQLKLYRAELDFSHQLIRLLKQSNSSSAPAKK